VWEGSTSKLIPDLEVARRFSNPRFAEAFARIECHYFVNGAFLDPPDQILRNVDVIRDIPGFIVHGRYDVVCPVTSAYELHQAWPESELHIVSDAGHSMTEPGIRVKLLEATERFAEY
jgi:proline iminopeptidase